MAVLKIWDGTAWQTVGGSVPVTGVSAPLTLTSGILDIAQASAVSDGSLAPADFAKIQHLVELAGGGLSVESLAGALFNAGTTTVYVGANLRYDGSLWQRLDTSRAVGLLSVDYLGNVTLYTAPAGANPIASFTSRSLTIAHFDKLVNWPRVRLAFNDAIDELVGTGGAAGVEFTLTTAQPFTVNSTSSILQIDCDLGAYLSTAAAGSAEVSVRAVIDLGSGNIRRKIGVGYSPGPTGSFFPITGGGFQISGLAAGAHTICLTAKANNAVIGYLRCNTQAEYEHASIYVTELTP